MSNELSIPQLMGGFNVGTVFLTMRSDGKQNFDIPRNFRLSDVSQATKLLNIENDIKTFSGNNKSVIVSANASRKHDFDIEANSYPIELVSALNGEEVKQGSFGIHQVPFTIPSDSKIDYKIRKMKVLCIARWDSTDSVTIAGIAATIISSGSPDTGEVLLVNGTHTFNKSDAYKTAVITYNSNGITITATFKISSNLIFNPALYRSTTPTVKNNTTLLGNTAFDFTGNSVPDINKCFYIGFGLLAFNPEFVVATGKNLIITAYAALIGTVTYNIAATEMPAADYSFYITQPSGYNGNNRVELLSDYKSAVGTGTGYVIANSSGYAVGAKEVLIADGTGTILQGNSISFNSFAEKYLVAKSSTANNYLVNGAANSGVKVVAVDTGTGNFSQGDKVKFGLSNTDYTVAADLSGAGNLQLTTALVTNVADNTVITITARLLSLSNGLTTNLSNGATVVVAGGAANLEIGDDLLLVNNSPSTGEFSHDKNYYKFSGTDVFDKVRIHYDADYYSFTPEFPNDGVFVEDRGVTNSDDASFIPVSETMPMSISRNQYTVGNTGGYSFPSENSGETVIVSSKYKSEIGQTIVEYNAPAGAEPKVSVTVVYSFEDAEFYVEYPQCKLKSFSQDVGGKDFKQGKFSFMAESFKTFDSDKNRFVNAICIISVNKTSA
jgi:hypothetical protein